MPGRHQRILTALALFGGGFALRATEAGGGFRHLLWPLTAEEQEAHSSGQRPPVTAPDTDQDGLADEDEAVLGLDPFDPEDGRADLDGDNYDEAWEWHIGSDPLDALDPEGNLWGPCLPARSTPLPVSRGVTGPNGITQSTAGEPPVQDLGDLSFAVTFGQNDPHHPYYPGGGFTYKRQAGGDGIGNWKAVVGTTIEYWSQANGQPLVVELEGNSQNYGIMQQITPLQGGFVLHWRHCGRESWAASGDNLTPADSEYRVLICADAEGVPDRSQVLAERTITPDQAWKDTGMGIHVGITDPVWIIFEPGSNNDTRGALVSAIGIAPVNIREVISDQIAGNEANKLPTPWYRLQANNPLLMATRSGQDAHLALRVEVPAALAPEVRVGIRLSENPPGIIASAPSVPAPDRTLLNFTAENGSKMYQVVAGYDENEDGDLDPEEARLIFLQTPKTNPDGGPYTGGDTHFELIDRIIVVTEADYNAGRAATEGYGNGNLVNHFCPTAASLVVAFATGSSTVAGASPTAFGVPISSTQPGISHPLGAVWNASNEATTHRVIFDSASPFTGKVLNSEALKEMHERIILSHLETLVNGATPAWGTVSLGFMDSDLDFSKDDDDVRYTLGKASFVGTLEVSCRKISPTQVEVAQVNCYGSIPDLYDWAYGADDIAFGIVTLASPKQAARTQAGHATLSAAPHPDAGRIFFVEVQLGTGWIDLPNGPKTFTLPSP